MARKKEGVPQVRDLVWYEDPQGEFSDTYWVISISEDDLYTLNEWKNESGKGIDNCPLKDITLE